MQVGAPVPRALQHQKCWRSSKRFSHVSRRRLLAQNVWSRRRSGAVPRECNCVPSRQIGALRGGFRFWGVFNGRRLDCVAGARVSGSPTRTTSPPLHKNVGFSRQGLSERVHKGVFNQKVWFNLPSLPPSLRGCPGGNHQKVGFVFIDTSF